MDEYRYRQAEERLWDSLGLEPIETMLEVDLDGVSAVRVQEFGEGPAIVMVHGGAVGGASWAPLAAALGDFRCILLDRPGCGLSPAVDRTFTVPDEFRPFAAAAVPAVLDAMDLQQAHLLCTSLGGLYGFHTAAAFPA